MRLILRGLLRRGGLVVRGRTQSDPNNHGDLVAGLDAVVCVQVVNPDIGRGDSCHKRLSGKRKPAEAGCAVLTSVRTLSSVESVDDRRIPSRPRVGRHPWRHCVHAKRHHEHDLDHHADPDCHIPYCNDCFPVVALGWLHIPEGPYPVVQRLHHRRDLHVNQFDTFR